MDLTLIARWAKISQEYLQTVPENEPFAPFVSFRLGENGRHKESPICANPDTDTPQWNEFPLEFDSVTDYDLRDLKITLLYESGSGDTQFVGEGFVPLEDFRKYGTGSGVVPLIDEQGYKVGDFFLKFLVEKCKRYGLNHSPRNFRVSREGSPVSRSRGSQPRDGGRMLDEFSRRDGGFDDQPKEQDFGVYPRTYHNDGARRDRERGSRGSRSPKNSSGTPVEHILGLSGSRSRSKIRTPVTITTTIEQAEEPIVIQNQTSISRLPENRDDVPAKPIDVFDRKKSSRYVIEDIEETPDYHEPPGMTDKYTLGNKSTATFYSGDYVDNRPYDSNKIIYDPYRDSEPMYNTAQSRRQPYEVHEIEERIGPHIEGTSPSQVVPGDFINPDVVQPVQGSTRHSMESRVRRKPSYLTKTRSRMNGSRSGSKEIMGRSRSPRYARNGGTFSPRRFRKQYESPPPFKVTNARDGSIVLKRTTLISPREGETYVIPGYVIPPAGYTSTTIG